MVRCLVQWDACPIRSLITYAVTGNLRSYNGKVDAMLEKQEMVERI